MSATITEAEVQMYSANVRMLGQLRKAKLRQLCEIETVVGRAFYGDRLLGSEAVTRAGRHQDNPYTPVTHSRRKGFIIDKAWGDYLDQQDTAKCVAEFKGKYVTLGVQAMNRAENTLILNALGGVAYAGEEGEIAVNCYDAAECRIINGSGTLATEGSDGSDTSETALTIAKLGLCGEILDDSEIDDDDETTNRYFVTNHYNKWQLLQTTEVKSADYNTVKALADGKIDTFMGFKFIFMHTKRFSLHAVDTTCIESYACIKNCVKLGVNIETSGEMWQDSGKENNWYCHAKMSKGAVRQEGPAVVKVLLKKSA